MSHYIEAEYPGGSSLLFPGVSGRTMRALAETGFDVYETYDAADLDGGVSGTGGSREIPHELARQAFLKALAWVKALSLSFRAWTPDKVPADAPDRLRDENEEELLRSMTGVVGVGIPVSTLAGGKTRLEEDAGELERTWTELFVPQVDVAESYDRFFEKLFEDLIGYPPEEEIWHRTLSRGPAVLQFSLELYRGTANGPGEMFFA